MEGYERVKNVTLALGDVQVMGNGRDGICVQFGGDLKLFRSKVKCNDRGIQDSLTLTEPQP